MSRFPRLTPWPFYARWWDSTGSETPDVVSWSPRLYGFYRRVTVGGTAVAADLYMYQTSDREVEKDHDRRVNRGQYLPSVSGVSKHHLRYLVLPRSWEKQFRDVCHTGVLIRKVILLW